MTLIANLGLPPGLISAVAGTNFTERVATPGYSPPSSDPFLRRGGFEVKGKLNVGSIVQGATFTISLIPPASFPGIPTSVATASVGTYTPLPGVTLKNGKVGFTRSASGFSGTLSGTATLPAWFAAAAGVTTATVNGTFTSTGQVTLRITVDGHTFDLVQIFNANVAQIVDMLVLLGENFGGIAAILFQHTSTSARAAAEQLIRIGATAAQMMAAVIPAAIDYLEMAPAVAIRVAFNAADDFTTRSFRNLVRDVFVAGDLYTDLGFANLVKAVLDTADEDTTETLATVVLEVFDAAWDFTDESFRDVVRRVFDAADDMTGAGFATIVRAVVDAADDKTSEGVSAIVYEVFDAALDFTDEDWEDIVYELFDAVDDLTSASLNSIVAALHAAVEALTDAGAKPAIRAVIAAVDELTTLAQVSYAQMAVALDAISGISFAEIVDALDVATNASLASMGTALDATTATSKQIMQALEDELDVTRYQTAEVLDDLGKSISTIIGALIDVYNAGYDSVFDVLQVIGFGVDQILAVICDFFDC